MSLMPIIYSNTLVFQQKTYKMLAIVSLFCVWKNEDHFSENRLKKHTKIWISSIDFQKAQINFELFYKECVSILNCLHVLKLM